MRTFHQLRVFGVIALTAIFAVSSPLCADDDGDEKKTEPFKVEAKITVEASAGGTHWIGVYAVPVEAALKSHLGIDDDRLIVQQVMADSPAKKAGLQEHDVILKYGATAVSTVDDLITAVGKAQGKETSLDLIRGGKKMSLKVTAEKRPEGVREFGLDAADIGDVQGLIRSWIQKQGQPDFQGSPLRFRVVGPGVVEQSVDVNELHQDLSGLPKNLQVEVRKDGDSPAKIKVTRDGKTWEVTEDNLDELPEDIRPHIKRSVGGSVGTVLKSHPERKAILRLKSFQLRPEGKALQIQPGQAAGGGAIQIRRLQSDEDVDQLRKDVEELKKAVKKLQSAKPKARKKEKETN